MIDLRRLRDEPDYRAGIERKRVAPGLIDDVLELDAQRRELQHQVEELRREQNAASKAIGKAAPEGRADKIAAAGALKEQLTALEGPVAQVQPEPLKPAVPIRKSVFADFIICLEDGKKLKMLKRHLRSTYNMTPDEYRTKWGLPHDYPMVAPNYAAARSQLAKKMGLGIKRDDKE